MAALDDPRRRRVGLLYDERMCRHATPDGESHPENPERIRTIWRKLESEGIPQRCVVMSAKEAEDKYIAPVHAQSHIKLIRNISSKEFDSQRLRIASKFNSIYFNKGSSEAAYLAAGSVVEVSEKVAKGDLDSAIALVRPPGHHAESDEAMGFCLFNNVAIAANFLLNERPELGIRKILIVDWDVHHGNGTQNMFYKDPRVLFFSVHRFDFGSFYPAGDDGSYCMVGEGPGAGYNINIPWEHGQCGDADYLAVWDHVLLPVVESYNPDIILISAGFDAAVRDPLGGCCVTPYGYSLMLKKLMGFARGKIVMALEGGYNLNSIANSVLACAKVLLEEKPIVGSIEVQPFESTWRVIQEVRHELKTFWPALAVELLQKVLVSNSRPCPVKLNLSSSSESDVESDVGASSSIYSSNFVEIIEPLSKLNIVEDNQGQAIVSNQIPSGQNPIVLSDECPNAQALPDNNVHACIPWRSVLSNIEVWYGSYGSNMWKPRFLCYIEGGKVEGMNKPCPGSRDKSSPKVVIWKTVPHRLFFARSHTRTWGEGGVAFLHPESNKNEKAYMCMYRITLEQFNDVLFQENNLHQENGKSQGAIEPLLDLSEIGIVAQNKSLPLEALKAGWYSNVLYLGKEDNLPILTMTCLFSEVERFKSGELPVTGPSNNYMNTLVRGLVEGKQLTREKAIAYINDAAGRGL
ncbi:histone deacetylase 5-like [Phoenix dactylifera]|uniref:histone deacetylase n=1 Tax=Phoenix dactylifera TaxID=42345 RepID=A0A8B7C422_PHODC|nr:histone deacetylase 5-like [Phoenix dactylifera]